MTKVDLITKVAESTGMTKKDADAAVSAVFNEITEALKSGDKVAIAGFGNFAVKERAEREGFNPSTKEKIKIAASKAATFKSGKALKDSLN